MKLKTLFFFIILLTALYACKQKKTQIHTETKLTTINQKNKEIVSSSIEDTLILSDSNSKKVRYPDPRDSVLRNYIDHRKPPRDSIDKWNEEVRKDKEKFTINPDENTKYFTLNSLTGEVYGSPIIKLKESLDDEYWKKQKSKRDSLRLVFEQIKPALKRSILEDKKEDLWYGDPKNVEIEGTPEGVHSGRGPIGYLFTNDSKYLIVPVGYPHGGMMDEIFFFDSKGKFISKTVLDKPLNMPFVMFNAEQTFVIVSNGVSGDFYFFRPNGQLFKKGDYNEFTGDRGTSYGKPFISETGKYFSLTNNYSWLYDSNDRIVSNLNFHILEISEKRDILFFIEYINIMEKKVRLGILNLKDNSLIYSSNIFKTNNRGYELVK